MSSICPVSLETLTDFVEKRLPDEEAAWLSAHVGEPCLHCAPRVRWLQQFMPSVAHALPDAAPIPSVESLAFVHSLGRLLAPERRQPGIVRYIAQLLTPAPSQVPVGLRGSVGSRSGTMVYQTDHHLVTLWSEPDGRDSYYLIGQIYARNGNPLPLHTVDITARDGAIQTAMHEGTEFSLRSIPAGVYLLCCSLGDAEIVVPQIEVGGA
jgi:hypothetical protein